MKAFTLIELVIVMTIMVFLAGIGFLSLTNYKNVQSVNSVSQEIVAVLRNAQNRSLSQEGGNRWWGVHFENPSSASGFYDLFSGASYSGSNIASRTVLTPGIQFGTPAAGLSSDVIFSPVSGLPDSLITIKIYATSEPLASSTITINQNGQILY